MGYILDDGWIIDEDTGEIEEAPEGVSDIEGHLVSKVDGATNQRDAWKATLEAYKHALMLHMDENRVTYPERGLTASIRSGSKNVQKLGPIREGLLALRLRKHEVADLLGAVARWAPTDAKLPRVRAILEAHISKESTKPYVIVDTVKQRAPRRVETLEEAQAG